MNEQECARIVSLVRTLYPHQKLDENPQNVVDAWSLVISDLEFDECRAAVVAHGRSAAPWCSPGDIRKRVARLRNVLAPHPDDVMAAVQSVANHGGEGRRQLHPFSQKIYAQVGGAPAISGMSPRDLLQLRGRIERDVIAHDEQVLTEPRMRPAAEQLEAAPAREISP